MGYCCRLSQSNTWAIITWSAALSANSACGSTKRVMSQGKGDPPQRIAPDSMDGVRRCTGTVPSLYLPAQ